MKLASFTAGQAGEIGIIAAKGVFPLSRVVPGLGNDMSVLIARWPEVEHEVRAIAARCNDAASEVLPLSAVHLLPPVPRPGKILAIGLNYRDHIEEANLGVPERQIWFCKQPSAVNGPYDPIPLPKVSQAVDYEAELVAVIGGGGRHISPENAPSAVFGFCCGNDVSVRDWQTATSQWMLGKSFDGHAPFGPWIVTADEVGNPHDLAITCRVNGAVRQNSNTRHLVFGLWDQIAHVSQVMTLEPGDVIFTGTPGGVGLGFKPPRYLRDGDVVRVEIEKLGHLEAVCTPEEMLRRK